MGKRSTRWLQFVVLAVAAFASIATSKKRGWILEADVANDAPGKARIAFVDASQEPDVTFDDGARAEPLGGYYTGIWSGTARYLIPADRKLAAATIDGPCGSGCNARSGCEPPAGEHVKVLSIKPVETWQREVVTAEVTEDLEFQRTTIPLVTTHKVRLELRAKGRGGRAYVVDDRILIATGRAIPRDRSRRRGRYASPSRTSARPMHPAKHRRRRSSSSANRRSQSVLDIEDSPSLTLRVSGCQRAEPAS